MLDWQRQAHEIFVTAVLALVTGGLPTVGTCQCGNPKHPPLFGIAYPKGA
ncbi:hypothetical protein SEA_LUMOS_128 [Mycobacterium phage Lumos]|uniref:Uncharacterized protein n=1 Tax=Mycobacterium phage Lumos TaxID=1701852 RepID=A0A0K2CMH3_9CAUD|nr:hypothetical protein AVU96_gp062 [Mycobacterium phage Snenia]YP_010012576.1 hypothetical protein J4T93_gp060 [Mycobacterium phage Lumos]ALA06634.1 hypothetical protein SEA_LUMOS_128 [Mycobacterium phage Lumos]ALF01573.1 hypothetical protein SNENIA_127 [Mycobacterium phage Snenia]ASM62855.1 hypothetical protein SEA_CLAUTASTROPHE_127 [Mycobacterium phage Clautastrophe]